MEESKALHKLSEVTDLVALVEEMINPSTADRLSPSAWSGIRITLRNVRESIQQSHSTLSGELLARARATAGTQAVHTAPAPQPHVTPLAQQVAVESSVNVSPVSASPSMTEAQRIQITRRDLKASLEKIIDQR